MCRYSLLSVRLLNAIRTAAVVVLLAGALCSPAAAQVWEFDPAGSNVTLEGFVFADDEACNTAAYPDPGNGYATEGPYIICPWGAPPPPPLPPAQMDWAQFIDQWQSGVLYAGCPGGAQSVADWASDLVVRVADGSPVFNGCWTGSPPSVVDSSASGIVTVTGAGTRTLEITWRSTCTESCTSLESYIARACLLVNAAINAQVVQAEPGDPLFILYEWELNGIADSRHEDPSLEDPVYADGSLSLDVAGGGVPGLLFDEWVDGDAGVPFLALTGQDAVPVTPGGSTVDVAVSLSAFSRARMATELPPLAITHMDGSGAQFCGRIVLTIFSRSFKAGEDIDTYMRAIPGSPTGQTYSSRAGRYEITNAQYADFLTDAQLDAGATGRSSNMSYTADGEVVTANGETLCQPQSLLSESRIIYKPNAPAGFRYAIEPGYENFPVVGVTWLGAAKFCNWLTLEQGMPANQRCYTEGSSAADWHPVTISAADWASRDLNTQERAALVNFYRGFRLPMDNLGAATGYLGDQNNAFNEWYQAAAYDAAGPAGTRSGPGGETIPASYWIYGCALDSLASSDANYLSSGDPFDDDDAPIGYFDGVNLLGDGVTVTYDARNAYDMYDLSGNIAEWGQDQTSTTDRRALRGGSWRNNASGAAASFRDEATLTGANGRIGFRVYRVAVPKQVTLSTPAASQVTGQNPQQTPPPSP